MIPVAILTVLKTAGGFIVKNWPYFAAGLLVIVLGVQTARLNHAKADQLDPKTKATWRSEYQAANIKLARAQQGLTTCASNQAVLQGAVDQQTQAAETQATAGRAALQRSQAAVDAAQKSAAKAEDTARRIAAAAAGKTACAAADAVDAELLRSLQ
jgi:hypothetical protein